MPAPGAFLVAIILPSAPSGIRAHAQHATMSLPAGLAFQNIGVPSRPQRKICDCNQEGRYIAMRNNTHFI